MNDVDPIIRFLKTAERRSRVNRILDEGSRGLAIALLLPVAFKITDLVSPFRGTTILLFFALWTIATIVWIAWQTRARESLERVAASIDSKAGTQDQIKSAYWFIRHPKESAWVDALIRRAGATATKIRVDAIIPRRIPRSSAVVAGLVLLIGVLNFIPLSWNHNWFFLQGAPTFGLTDAQRDLLRQAEELLKSAEQQQADRLAEQLARVIDALRDGSLSQSQLSRSLAEIQKALADRKTQVAQIADALERVAKALEPSVLTRPVANELFTLDLNDAAAKVRDIESNLPKMSTADLQEMAERFAEASGAAGKELEQLATYSKQASETLQRNDRALARQALEQIAKEFERLQRVLDNQRLRNEASDRISALQESVGGTPGEVAGGEGIADAQMTSSGKGEGEGTGQGQGEGEGVGQGEGEGQGQGEGEGEGQGGEGEGSGEGEGPGGGRGGRGVGTSGPLPARGEPTALDVQMQKEAIAIKPTRGSRPETIEEASQRERSKLDYRNVPSELSPAKKDSLHSTTVPLDQRQLIQKYFENLRRP